MLTHFVLLNAGVVTWCTYTVPGPRTRLLLLVVVLIGYKTLFPFLSYVTGEGFQLCGKLVLWYLVV